MTPDFEDRQRHEQQLYSNRRKKEKRKMSQCLAQGISECSSSSSQLQRNLKEQKQWTNQEVQKQRLERREELLQTQKSGSIRQCQSYSSLSVYRATGPWKFFLEIFFFSLTVNCLLPRVYLNKEKSNHFCTPN